SAVSSGLGGQTPESTSGLRGQTPESTSGLRGQTPESTSGLGGQTPESSPHALAGALTARCRPRPSVGRVTWRARCCNGLSTKYQDSAATASVTGSAT